MDPRGIIERLRSLTRLEHDAVRAYTRAIDNARTRDVKNALQRFRTDHERHVVDLTDAIIQLGGNPPELSREARGVFLEGMTAGQSRMGERLALRACGTGEKFVNYKYEQVAGEDFPPDIRALIDRNFADEQRHLAFVQERLQAAPPRRIRRAIGLGALGVAAGVVLWRLLPDNHGQRPGGETSITTAP
jgi:rubrerythrin